MLYGYYDLDRIALDDLHRSHVSHIPHIGQNNPLRSSSAAILYDAYSVYCNFGALYLVFMINGAVERLYSARYSERI